MTDPGALKHAPLLGILGLATLYALWYALRSWRQNRLVADTPTSRIRSAAQGYVELLGRGTLPAGHENRAPLTGRPCTWWRYEIAEQRGSGRSRRWSTVDRGESEIPFLLDDGTGRCLVDPRGARVFPSQKEVWYGDSAWPEVRLPKGSGLLGRTVDALLSGGRYRYTEYRMAPDELVCALGAYHSVRGDGLERPDEAVAALLRRWKQDQATLLARFDSDHDGRIDASEWEAARAAARREVVESLLTPAASGAQASAPGTDGGALALLAEPTDGRAFLLAASDGRSLAVRLRHQALTGLAGALAASAALIWLTRSP